MKLSNTVLFLTAAAVSGVLTYCIRMGQHEKGEQRCILDNSKRCRTKGCDVPTRARCKGAL